MIRRDFIKLSVSASSYILLPKTILASDYKGPVNWVGSSFLIQANKIEKDFPITKPASEILTTESNSTFLNRNLINKLKSEPLQGVNLKLEGYADNAEMALTYGFAAEFDFGTFVDNEAQKTAYLMYSFGQSLLYNPKSRMIISSVPVRAISTYLITFEEQKKFKNIKSELMRRSFYNSSNPEATIVSQFRKMIGKQSFVSKKWDGKKPKITNVKVPGEENLYLNFGLTKEKFKEFIGQSASFAFGYKLNSPIIPYMKTKGLGVTTIMRFNEATKLYQKIAAKLPEPDLSIEVIHQGWEFVEEPLQENAKSVLNVQLGMGIQVKVFDTFEEKEIYNQYFFASKQYIENKDNTMRSNAASVCELTEALLERIFLSIADRHYRQKMLNGDQIKSELYSAFFQLDNKNTDEVNNQSDAMLKAIPQ